MTRTARRDQGFTLIEMVVVVAIIGILAALGLSSIARQRPRARLATTAAEVHALLHGARLSAMANGKNVVVMVFPNFANQSNGTGRLVAYEDGNFDFFSPVAAVSFGAYDPAVRAAGNLSRVLEVVDLPREVRVGPATGMGPAAVLTAPLAGIPVNVACSFCGADRGAVVFDPRGRATFYTGNGTPMVVNVGASFTLFAQELTTGSRTVVITNTTGAVRTFNNG